MIPSDHETTGTVMPAAPAVPPEPDPSTPSRGTDPPDAAAAALRGFGPIGIAAMALVVTGNFLFSPLSAVLALVWARLSHTPWRALGYVRPASGVRELALGVAFGVTLKLVMKSVVMPLLGADPINPRYQHLVGDPSAVAAFLLPVIVGAGWGEEALFRGYLFERLGTLWGRRAVAKTATVVVTSTLFAVAHEGASAIQQAGIVGLIFGTIYATRGGLWLLVIAHAAFDLAAVAIIYANMETRIAHLFFR